MIITIRVPDNAVKLQYSKSGDGGYEEWQNVTMGDFVEVRQEDKSAGGTDEDEFIG